MELTKERIDLIRKERQERFENNIKEYPEERWIYQRVFDFLIFEMENIEPKTWMYNYLSIIEWLKEKQEDKENFDNILEMYWK